jgi:transposase
MTLYIGIDAHYATSTFVTLDEAGTIIKKAKTKTCKSAVLAYMRSEEHHGQKMKATLEETNMSHWYYKVLRKKVDELIICNPLYISKRSGAKNDFRDALHLANELRGNHLTPVYHEDSALMDMRSLVTGYSNLTADIRRSKNRYKALFRSEALPTEGGGFYDQKENTTQLKQTHHSFIAENLYIQIEHLSKLRDDYISRLTALTKDLPVVKKLCTIPGIDVIRASVIAARICSAKRFRTKHQLWSYSMLVKHKKDSDGVTYKKYVSWGRSDLKCVFDGAAESVLCSKSSLRKHYDDLRQKGISHRNAKKSLARKIAAISLQILKSNKKYDDNYEEKKGRENLNTTR